VPATSDGLPRLPFFAAAFNSTKLLMKQTRQAVHAI